MRREEIRKETAMGKGRLSTGSRASSLMCLSQAPAWDHSRRIQSRRRSEAHASHNRGRTFRVQVWGWLDAEAQEGARAGFAHEQATRIRAKGVAGKSTRP